MLRLLHIRRILFRFLVNHMILRCLDTHKRSTIQLDRKREEEDEEEWKTEKKTASCHLCHLRLFHFQRIERWPCRQTSDDLAKIQLRINHQIACDELERVWWARVRAFNTHTDTRKLFAMAFDRGWLYSNVCTAATNSNVPFVLLYENFVSEKKRRREREREPGRGRDETNAYTEPKSTPIEAT